MTTVTVTRHVHGKTTVETLVIDEYSSRIPERSLALSILGYGVLDALAKSRRTALPVDVPTTVRVPRVRIIVKQEVVVCRVSRVRR